VPGWLACPASPGWRWLRTFRTSPKLWTSAGLIPEPAKDQRSRSRYVTTRREGLHQLRHYYASVMLAGASLLRSSPNTSATATQRSLCASTPTCSRAPTIASAPWSTNASPGPRRPGRYHFH